VLLAQPHPISLKLCGDCTTGPLSRVAMCLPYGWNTVGALWERV